jgi:hypothetical protein
MESSWGSASPGLWSTGGGLTDVAQRIRARLAESDPARAARLEGLRHVLPSRPGGIAALLDAAPDLDVVVIAHAGLDRWASLRELARAVPVHDRIAVATWRIRRSDIPTAPDERLRWLDERWRRVDAWVDAELASTT